MYSFYGGRPGNSFVIVTTYKSVNDMVDKFKQGPAYTAVHYDEYVMINTANKNDEENGRLYRRGYDFTNEMGGAEYVGTIVGPSGPAPMLVSAKVSEIEQMEIPESEEARRDTVSLSIDNDGLVPGKYVDSSELPQYNDEIKWAYCSIRDANGEDCTAYVGFTIPYTVIDFTSTSVDPYINSEDLIARVDDGKHPFYEKWNINIPKGIKGDTVKDLKVITMTNNTSIDDYPGKDDDIKEERKILAYTFYDYSSNEDGNPKTCYLGDYNMIKNVYVEESDGTLVIEYTHDDATRINRALKTIESVSLDENTGIFRVTYNQPVNSDGTNYSEFSLRWVKDIDIDSTNGKITLYYSNDESEVINAKLKWITNTTMEKDDGIITVEYNDGSKVPLNLNTPLKWIKNIDVATDGSIFITYNDNIPTSLATKIKWIEDVTFSDDGTVNVSYNYGDPYTANTLIKWVNAIALSEEGMLRITYNNGDPIDLGPIKWLKNINVDDHGSINITYNDNTTSTLENKIRWPNNFRIDDSQRLTLDWNTGDSLNIGNPINYILETGIDAAGHLLVRYSDPAKNDNITFKGISGWTDIGSVQLSDIEYDGNSITNLNWNGMGVLRNTNIQSEAEKIVQFTLVPTQLLRHNLTNVTINAGTITVVQRGQSGAITGLNSADLTQVGANVTKTFTGIDFEIPSGIASDSSAAPVFVDIIIEGLSLTFS